jgi:hypothetical protein
LAKAAETRERLRRAREAYRGTGRVWMLMTEREVGGCACPEVVDEIVANAGRPIDPNDLGRLRTFLAASGGAAAMGDCEETLRAAEFPRGEILSRIAERLVAIDLHAPITPDTLVRLVEA